MESGWNNSLGTEITEPASPIPDEEEEEAVEEEEEAGEEEVDEAGEEEVDEHVANEGDGDDINDQEMPDSGGANLSNSRSSLTVGSTTNNVEGRTPPIPGEQAPNNSLGTEITEPTLHIPDEEGEEDGEEEADQHVADVNDQEMPDSGGATLSNGPSSLHVGYAANNSENRTPLISGDLAPNVPARPNVPAQDPEGMDLDILAPVVMEPSVESPLVADILAPVGREPSVESPLVAPSVPVIAPPQMYHPPL
jgi:hypothetical protein